jgi:cellulose synthase (UDP-forming)
VTGGEFFLVFDADFAPRADFLAETMPYFDDPAVAVVQTPQFFRTRPGQSWVERGAGSLQEIFFRAIQVTRNQFGAAMCVGSNVIYRRSLLQKFGGISEVSYAEDVHTGLEAIRNGGKLAYLPVVLAAGICPDSINAYVRQQYRWGAGTLSVGFTRRLWNADVPLRTKLAYFSGSVYNIFTAVTVFVTPLIPIVMLEAVPATIRLSNWIILLPAILTGFVLYPLWHMNDYRLRDALPLLLLRGWANALAVWDYSRGRIMGWQPTGSKVSPLRRLWWGVRVWNGGATVAWVALAAWRIHQTHSPRFAVLGAFGLIQAAIVFRVIFPGKRAA